MTLVKTSVLNTTVVGDPAVANVGDTIQYSFVVTNTGNVTLSNVVINDDTLSATPFTVGTLAVGASVTITTPDVPLYILTQSDLDAGQATNTATATGTTPGGGTTTDVSDDGITENGNDNPTVTPLTQVPSLTMLKTGLFNDNNSDGVPQVGETITYTFTVTNTGNVTVTNVLVNDALTGTVLVPVTPTDLLPGQIGTLTVNYPITQANIDAGQVLNSASTTGSIPGGGNTTDVSDEGNPDNGNDNPTITPLTTSRLSLIKTAVVGGDGVVGDVITYTFTVTNVGTATISNIVINDALTNTVNQALVPATLNPGEVGTLTATYVITQTDVNNCQVVNTATVVGQNPAGVLITDVSDDGDNTNGDDNTTVSTLCTINNDIAVVKTGVFNDLNNDGFAQVNETITYTFTVTNTGNSILYNAVITDDFLPGLVWNLPTPVTIPELLPGESFTGIQAVYYLTQEDLDRGQVTNQASVRAVAANGEIVEDISDDDSNNFDDPTVIVLDGCTVKVYNLVSQTIAGYEHLHIQGIECYPNNSVMIYNRWGVLVYETTGYNNEDKAFRGISEGRVTVDKSTGLPEGTYYYILKYVKEGQPIEKAGFLHLTR